ncbi:MAG: secondary thiamine-phosphate synthase enzyme YjbQ [Desulfobacterales bacterium]|jgi:secondary thiamine-phosphate synthase enzyme|nr:secondary thiamine-phosphate synthase enzyme YjbQ [Desulfobacterales bacterium]
MPTIRLTTRKKAEFIDITADVRDALKQLKATEGFCLIFVPHTTAAVTVNESADPDVAADILTALDRLVPWEAGYRHREGNAAAHIKSTLVGASQWLAVESGEPVLGTWQGIFFCEFDGPRPRKVQVRFVAAASDLVIGQ